MKKTALMLAVAALALPSVSMAGGELQQYQATSSYSASAGYGAYPPAGASNGYARPMGAYAGNPCASPCATQPYGYSSGGAGFGMRSDILTAGLLGLGIGYLIFH